LDTLGCCIALGPALFQAYREQIVEFGGTVGSTRIGGGNENPIPAAFWHTAVTTANLAGRPACNS